MTVITPAFPVSAGSYGAEQARRAWTSLLARGGGGQGSIAGGLIGSADFALTAPVSGMTVNVAAGEAWVPGSTGAHQTGYHFINDGTVNLAVAASNATNPRVDSVTATITDAAYIGATNAAVLQVNTGTPTGGATLVNLTGAPALPTSSLLLGYILVPANSTNVTAGNISNAATVLALPSGMIQGLTTSNLAAALAQSAAVNQSAQTVKGAVNIVTSQSTSSATYTTLTTPDQVAGIVLPTNGLIRVWYQAQWQESVQHSARAAIFLGNNQQQVQSHQVTTGPHAIAAAIETGGGAAVNVAQPLATFWGGVAGGGAGVGAAADVTTGQAIGVDAGFIDTGSGVQNIDVGASSSTFVGGPCDIFAAAGTYTISVRFKATLGGTVTAAGRTLWVQAISFA